LRLITAHGAKGLEFSHVIVMDCADWRSDGDDDRRLLYVAMTRARETLVTIRAEDGRNPYLTDIASVDGVVEVLPTVRPAHRPELDRRYMNLSPADADLGYAGRRPAGNRMHADIAAVRVGDEIRVANRQLLDRNGNILGRLAKKCDLPNQSLSGQIFAVMVRTRAQTHPAYLAGIQVEQWEVPLAEVVVP
jgi:ATP-dependent DNA helicase RecQ